MPQVVPTEGKYPLLVCGTRAVLQPFAPDNANAFNPCFVAWCFAAVAAAAALGCLYDLWRCVRAARGGGGVAAALAPRHTGLAHYIRCNAVATHAAGYVLLTATATNVHARYADTKIVAFAAMLAVLAMVVLPLHAVEVATRATPSLWLLVFWPALSVLQAVLLFQDASPWPLLVGGSAVAAAECFLLANAVAIVALELRRWRASHVLVQRLAASGRHHELAQPNLYSRLTYSWMNPVIRRLYLARTLAMDDLPSISHELLAELSTRALSKAYRRGPTGRSRRLLAALARAFGRIVLTAFACEMGSVALLFLQPQLLRTLIRFFAEAQTPAAGRLLAVAAAAAPIRGVAIALAIFVVSILQTALDNQYVLLILKAGLGARLSLTSLLYQKSLRLLMALRQRQPTGDIVNLVLVDVDRVQQVTQNIQTLVVAPTQLVLCLALLYSLVGAKPTAASCALLVVLVPLNLVIIRYLKRLSKTQMRFKDLRSRTMAEILTGIKLIKLYGWEEPMGERLHDVRVNQELANLKRIRTVNIGGSFVWLLIPFWLSFVTFATFSLTLATPLTSDIVFPTLALLNMLLSPLVQFPVTLTQLIESGVLLGRIARFLELPEAPVRSLETAAAAETPAVVEITRTTFLWEPVSALTEAGVESPRVALSDISFEARRNDLHCLVGRVGSGKLTMLMAILGQLDAVGAGAAVRGLVAYCAQSPWIMNALVRDNIVFGHEYDAAFYTLTVRCCQLEPDLAVLPDGDATLVGEKGILLSGGQKARLALARAVYLRSDLYLLDDVLLAVDSHVGKQLIEQVLSRQLGLLRHKTVVMATNSLAVLSYSTAISLVERGRIVERGTFGEIKDGRLFELLSEFGREAPSECPPPVSHPMDAARLAPFQWKSLADAGRLAQPAERSAKGRVQWHVYREYINAASRVGVCLWLAFLVLTSVFAVAANYWLKHWAEHNSASGANRDAVRYIAVYAVLGLSSSLCTVARGALLWTYLAIAASTRIHDRMARALLRAPMAFFETTPAGRITNRFTSDISKVDDTLPRAFGGFFLSLTTTVFTLGVVAFVVPPFIAVVVVLLFVYFHYQKLYLSVSRELKRLAAVLRLPIYAHIQESLNGVDTIRAFNQGARFTFLNDANLNFNMKLLYMLRALNRWLLSRLQFIGLVAVLAAALLSLATLWTRLPLTAGTAGFVMTYALLTTNSLSFVVRMSAEVESTIVAFERCLEYTELPEEEPAGQYRRLGPAFPARGTIEFDHYSARYRANLDLVLKDVSVSIGAGEKVGVVGRTGAGKSSLALALFRIIEAALGCIRIDDVDIATLLVYDLRQHLLIIPQDSQAFEGTVRQNLDPLARHSDAELWHVLGMAHLQRHVEDAGGLDYHVSEGGANLLAGQLQLMCLARALLNRSKIIVLDEATAAVDVQTDKIIQQTIRTAFANRTIITIAHRLDTVMDSDKILTLDHGTVKEFGPPQVLLADPNGVFHQLCHQGGYIE